MSAQPTPSHRATPQNANASMRKYGIAINTGTVPTILNSARRFTCGTDNIPA